MKWTIAGLLVLAVITALSAAMLMLMLSGRHGTDVTVLVAKHTLPANTVIEASALEEKSIPRAKLPEFALTNSIEAIGKILKEPVYEGQPLRKEMFLTQEQKELATKLQPGQRAVAISLSDFAGLDGVLYSGSVVDVVLTVNSQNGKSVSRTVLEGVQVLAIDRQTIVGKEVEEKPADNDRRGQNARRVTLLVNSQQAAELSLATSLGSLSLALRNPLDKQAAYRGQVSLTSLLPSKESSSWLKSLAEAAQAAQAMAKTEPVAVASAEKPQPQTPTLFETPKTSANPTGNRPGWTTTIVRGATVETVDFPDGDEHHKIAKEQ
jgi:Flp pilus assembly protein CpaB